jgi:hypothetical protein
VGYKKKVLPCNKHGYRVTKDTPLKPHHVEILQKIKLALWELGDLWHPMSYLLQKLPEHPYQTVIAVLDRLIDNGEVERMQFRFRYGDKMFRKRRFIRLPDIERSRLDELLGKNTFMAEQDVIEFIEQDS